MTKKVLKALLTYFLFIIFLSSCKMNNDQDGCINSKNISFDFSGASFNFKDEDLLIIDDLTFKHSYYSDSLNNGFYLPKEEIIILQLKGKTAKQKTNSITYNRFLARHLKNSNFYQIDNPHKLLAVGVLDISRKDGKSIQVCGSKNLIKHVRSKP